MPNFSSYLSPLPLIAILRGIRPEQAQAVAEVLYAAGFRCIEVPMNSPEPLLSIQTMVQSLPDDCLIGAGTVMNPQQVSQIADVGGRLIVMPHSAAHVIHAAKEKKLFCTPGVATMTEAFAALEHGADALKLFPAQSVPTTVLRAWRSVLPKETICLPVGGINPADMHAYFAAGANGFGLGNSLYQAGMQAEEVAQRAALFVASLKQK